MVPQWDSEGALLSADTLPSFYYLPVKSECKKGLWALPWDLTVDGGSSVDFAVGRVARLKSSQTPGRVIHSAKSWLCHSGVDRTERILPWHSDEVIGDERRSPIEVSASYLRHLRLAWNHVFCDQLDQSRFEDQDVVITVPASFDEVAQRLTLEAAILAGYSRDRVKLLEEPQAAFYEWLGRHRDTFDDAFRRVEKKNQTILVCDIGGGTTDFTLLSVTWAMDGRPEIKRIGVSDHLLLGGDNIDLSLARVMERKLLGDTNSLSSREWAQLVFEARRIKEKALSELVSSGENSTSEEELFVSIAREGSSLLATAMTVGLLPKDIERHIVEGFFPFVPRDARPDRPRGALSQLGLPYAADSAVTKHLAHFLSGRMVDGILFAGGTMKPPFIRERILSQISAWQGSVPFELSTDSMDLAVSRGAAEFALAKRPTERRLTILGGYSRSLYLEVASDPNTRKLICIVPKGFSQAEPLRVSPPGLKVMTNRPVRFQIFSALDRDKDRAGDVVAWEEGSFHRLPSLDTKLLAKSATAQGDLGNSSLLDVVLEISLQSSGILDLVCVPTAGGSPEVRWNLEFNLQKSDEIPVDVHAKKSAVSSDKVDLARKKIDELYGKKRPVITTDGNPKYLVRDLEHLLGMPRDEWDSGFLRSLWPHLEQGLTRRNRSLGHELSWLYLAGFALRPGYGYELDEWRIGELWRVYDLGLAFPKERQAEEQWWILWRRVAGGLSKTQQEQIYSRIFPLIRKGEAPSAEIYLLAASLERIDMLQKVRLGQYLVQQISSGKKQHIDQKIWALARISSRIPLYAEPQAIVRPSFIENWADGLKELDLRQPPYSRLMHFYAQAGRVVGDREFDISSNLRRDFLQRLKEARATSDYVDPVNKLIPVATKDQTRLFGESLPAGLWLGA